MSKKHHFNFAPPQAGECDLLIIAGEHSGDEQAARMLRGALKIRPDLKVCAFGGEKLREAGAELVFDMTSFSVVGLFEVLKNYSFFKELAENLADWIQTHKPKAVCFVDYPGFNLHLASVLKKRGISVKGGGNVKLLYYIGPQIWAWKAKRRFKMANLLDELALIFPFEPNCYADTSLPAHFVGHPFLDESYENPLFYDAGAPLLLLAGSRLAAVQRIFPRMLAALELLPKDVCAFAPCPTERIFQAMTEALKKHPNLNGRVEIARNSGKRIGARAVLMSSGTMSLSCSLAGIPGAIVYVANPFTYMIGRALVKVKYLGMANIILDRPAWEEFIQFAASPSRIAAKLRKCLSLEAAEQSKKFAEELKTILHSPPKMSAANWLVENCK